ncbi:MAG TPA: Ig-like domain-containing protein, partial [Gemmatimonadaceae bacterium]|nr:Ig-like domain-containing protein [Gemmatimonadaceae bacterium]
ATIRDASGAVLTGRSLAWSSDNTAVATVNGSGLVTAVATGTASITGTSEGKSGSATLTVNPNPITSTTVTLASPTAIGTTTQATATFKDASGNLVAATITGWSSDNTSVATVTASGVVTSVGLGTATITVSSNGPPGSAAMVVAPSVGYGSSNERIRIVDIGTAFTPTLTGASASATTFTSRAPGVVTVDGQGKVTAVAPGQVWVAATASGFAPDSIYVIVPRNSSGPLLRSDLTEYRVKAGASVVVNVILDTRATPIGGTELTVGYTTNPTVFQSVSVTAMGSPLPVVSNLQEGVFRVSLASGSALAGQLTILRFTFTAPNASGVEVIPDRSGYLTLTLIDLVDPSGADILPSSTSTRIPIIITR